MRTRRIVGLIHRRALWVLAVLVIATLAMSGCEASACAGSGCAPKETAVTSLALGPDYQNGKLTSTTTTFQPTDTIHVAGQADIATTPTNIKGVWTAVDAGGAQNQAIIDKSIVWDKNPASGVDFHFSFTHDKAMPAGKYKVDVYLNDTLAKTAEFTVPG